MDATFSMTQLAREFDLTSRAIRYYEQEGLIAPSRRGRTRVFSLRDRTRLRLIQRGRRLGFSIAEIREILNLYDDRDGERGQLVHFVRKIRERRASLEVQRRDIDAILEELDRLEAACLDRLE
ncbi:transcriptional regulator, MerR family protein [alpha proteobacterium BAL199]|jgi:DNA-binding transcriptional MerR regulator|nr:transcriptional regulator, MerR family protein [alpha proteobacterium BAL199]